MKEIKSAELATGFLEGLTFRVIFPISSAPPQVDKGAGAELGADHVPPMEEGLGEKAGTPATVGPNPLWLIPAVMEGPWTLWFEPASDELSGPFAL